MIEAYLVSLGIPVVYQGIIEVALLVLFAASEAIGMSKSQDNSVLQFIAHVAKRLKPLSNKDERIAVIARELEELRKEVKFSPNQAIDELRRGR